MPSNKEMRMQKSDLSFKSAEHTMIKSHMSYYKKDMFVCVQKIYSSTSLRASYGTLH